MNEKTVVEKAMRNVEEATGDIQKDAAVKIIVASLLTGLITGCIAQSLPWGIAFLLLAFVILRTVSSIFKYHCTMILLTIIEVRACQDDEDATSYSD